MALKKLNADLVQTNIQKLLDFTTFQPEHRYWLDTGSLEMNATLGSAARGIPYGKVIEIAGEEHSGKTALALVLAGMGQKEGAGVGYMDVEDSRDPVWSQQLGMDYAQVVEVYKKMIQHKKSRPPIMQSAEELFAEMETGMKLIRRQGIRKQIWIVDSIAFLQPALVVEAGVMHQNMRTNLERAIFLSRELPAVAGLAAYYNAMVLLVNHIRTKPGVMFGNPEYTPGGHALRHTCSVRVRTRRIKNGEVRSSGKIVGLLSSVKNVKNKAGGGSVQGASAAMKIRWDSDPARVRFLDMKRFAS